MLAARAMLPAVQLKLWEASEIGDAAEVKRCLEVGAKVEAKNRLGWNAMHRACTRRTAARGTPLSCARRWQASPLWAKFWLRWNWRRSEQCILIDVLRDNSISKAAEDIQSRQTRVELEDERRGRGERGTRGVTATERELDQISG